MKTCAAGGPWEGEEIHFLSKLGAGGGEGGARRNRMVKLGEGQRES